MERFDLLINNFKELSDELNVVRNQLKKENKDVFNAIVENSTNFIAIIQDDKYVFVNTYAIELMHCKSSTELINSKFINHIFPEYQKDVTKRIKNIHSKSNNPIQLKINRLDNTYFYCECNFVPFLYNKKPAVLIIGSDITSDIEQKTIIENERKLRTNILNAFEEVIAFYNPAHEVVWLNDSAKRQLNIKDDSYMGKLCYKLWFSSNKPCATCPVVHNKYETTERIISFNDPRIWKIRHIPLFTSENELDGYIEFRMDITEDVNKEKKQKQVAADALYINQKNSILTDIEDVLNKIFLDNKIAQYKANFKKLYEIINNYKLLDKDWKMFIANFEQVHPGFFKRLTNTYPLLSSNDIKHCACIKMNLDTKEIARFFNVKVTSVQASRVRLKKKMNLSPSTDLRIFILNY